MSIVNDFLKEWFNCEFKMENGKVVIRRVKNEKYFEQLGHIGLQHIIDESISEEYIDYNISSKIKEVVSELFTKDLINDAIIENDIEKKIKIVIAREINKRIIRDAPHIVNEALGNLEDKTEITLAVRTSVINKMKNSIKDF